MLEVLESSTLLSQQILSQHQQSFKNHSLPGDAEIFKPRGRVLKSLDILAPTLYLYFTKIFK